MTETGKTSTEEPDVASEDLRVRVARPVIEALDAYASDEAVTRDQAVRAILADWLRTHGYGPAGASKPVGPATDAVTAMDAAIKQNRTRR